MGGSGGGGRGLNKDQLKHLEQLAKEKLKGKKDASEKRNVFISFDSGDIDAVNLLRGQAKKDGSDLEFNDWSLKEPFDSKKAEYIKRGIRERIRQSSVTICYVSNKTAKSKWVDWEVKESLRLGKKVIAVYQGDSAPSSIPTAIKDNGISLVKWNHKEIMKVIDKG